MVWGVRCEGEGFKEQCLAAFFLFLFVWFLFFEGDAEGYDACQGGFVLGVSVCFQVGNVSSTRVVPNVCVTSDLISCPASFLHPLPAPRLSGAAPSPARSLGQDFNIYHRLVG